MEISEVILEGKYSAEIISASMQKIVIKGKVKKKGNLFLILEEGNESYGWSIIKKETMKKII